MELPYHDPSAAKEKKQLEPWVVPFTFNFDNERLRKEPALLVGKFDRFMDFHRDFNEEADRLNVTPRQLLRIHRELHPRKGMVERADYNEFSEAIEWLHKPKEKYCDEANISVAEVVQMITNDFENWLSKFRVTPSA